MNPHQQQLAAESRQWGRQLADYFAAGNEPAERPSPIALAPQERYHYGTSVQVWQWLEGDGTYTHSSGVAVGGLAFMGAFYAANAIGNANRRARAARDAQPQWRQIGNAMLHLTSRRFALQGLPEWIDIGYEHVRASSCEGGGVTMEINGWAPTRFVGHLPDYWFVMFRRIAYGEILRPVADDGPVAPGGPQAALPS